MRTLRSSTCDTCGRRLILLCTRVSIRFPLIAGHACALSPSDTKSSPSFSLRSLQSLEHMEKLQRRARSLGWRTSGKFLDCLFHRPRAINLDHRRKPQVWEKRNQYLTSTWVYPNAYLRLTGNVHLPIHSLLWLRTHDCNLTLAWIAYLWESVRAGSISGKCVLLWRRKKKDCCRCDNNSL